MTSIGSPLYILNHYSAVLYCGLVPWIEGCSELIVGLREKGSRHLTTMLEDLLWIELWVGRDVPTPSRFPLHGPHVALDVFRVGVVIDEGVYVFWQPLEQYIGGPDIGIVPISFFGI
nr:hypothetical protein [Tanacetum cinerariifolium]